MTQQPTLRTSRLILRPFQDTDAPAVQRLASAREVALNTLTVPHPYPDGAAEAWIVAQRDEFENGMLHNFAAAAGEELIGSIGLMMKGERIAEIGYWIGVPYWGRGYASEAAAELIRHGFEDLGLERIYAGYYARNEASGRVLQKLGMVYEGTMRRHVCKWGEYLDVVCYGLLRDEWLSSATRSTASPAGAGEERKSAGL
ncbi:MAG TPA: GNAT family protein [Thermoanaerobaculia bacterium]|nr:GNAT family protein [Thermoanaerobaculia bacterium]